MNLGLVYRGSGDVGYLKFTNDLLIINLHREQVCTLTFEILAEDEDDCVQGYNAA
jgi:hypothetical protein